MNPLIVYGTRPEEIKLYSLWKKTKWHALQVNQSKDLHQGMIDFTDSCEEEELKDIIKECIYSHIIVQGDTRTAFRAALYAFESGIPVVHIEAGLRTHDLTSPFPEEGYRCMIDEISTYKFCSTPQSVNKCGGVYVGNTGTDTLFMVMAEENVGITSGKYDLVTCHRRENLENVFRLAGMVQNDAENPIIISHPNKTSQEFCSYFDKAQIRPPVPYREMVKLLAGCNRVFTDSGGLQEDAIALGKEVISLRDKSERGNGETYETGATDKIINILTNDGRNHS